jgi:hypothetical protein
MVGKLTDDALARMWKEAAVAMFQGTIQAFALEDLQDSQCSGQDSNQALPEYKSDDTVSANLLIDSINIRSQLTLEYFITVLCKMSNIMKTLLLFLVSVILGIRSNPLTSFIDIVTGLY